MSKAILYSSISSPHCFKVSMVLEEKGVSFERVEINLREKEQKSEAYLELNPRGQVPAYKDDQGMVIDSLDIMQHLDKRYPSPKLFPDGEGELKDVLEWIESSSSSFRDISHHLYWQLLQPPEGGTDYTEVNRLKTLGYEQLSFMEQALEKNGEWLCGNLSAADFSVFALEARPSVLPSYQQQGKAFSEHLADSSS